MDFHCRVFFSLRTRVNKIETMYGMALEYVKDEPRSTFMFTRGRSYIASISFTRVIIIEAMYGGSCVNEEVEPRATFTFKHVNLESVRT